MAPHESIAIIRDSDTVRYERTVFIYFESAWNQLTIFDRPLLSVWPPLLFTQLLGPRSFCKRLFVDDEEMQESLTSFTF